MAEKQKSSTDCRGLQLRLPQHRRKARVSLKRIAETTKINRRFLRAIEAEEFEKLPGGVFNTSYIRQYAAAIGFDEEELLACYRARVGSTELDLSALLSARLATNGNGRRSPLHWFRALGFTKHS